MFLVLYHPSRTGHRLVGRDEIQSGPGHSLLRGEPDPVFLAGCKAGLRFWEPGYSTVVRVQETTMEHSFGAWWPYHARRLWSLANHWPALQGTEHLFPDGRELVIQWATAERPVHWVQIYSRDRADMLHAIELDTRFSSDVDPIIVMLCIHNDLPILPGHEPGREQEVSQ